MKSTFLLFIVAICLSATAFAQEVERNYTVGPQETNCDSLNLSGKEVQEQIDEIKNAKFRYTQHFTLNRKQGFQGGWYYSCDNKTGYLVVKRDNNWELYDEISKSTWKAFVQSGAFEKFIKEHIISTPE